MSNIHTLADVKAKYGEKVIETGTSFVVNAYGKYQPNISFVLAKDFGGDPLKYRNDAPAREMIAGMGLGFGTSESGVSVLFGDFWSSKAGKPHFRPKSPQVATHVIVRADWGGFNHPRTRGSRSAPEGAAYFRRASSNGGGTGYDYYVLPVGYYLIVRDEELDGDAVVTPDFTERAKAVRASFATFDRTVADKAAAEAQAKVEAEAASRDAKSDLLPRLVAAQTRLDALRSSNTGTSYNKLELGETHFVFGWSEKLYTEANVAEVEKSVTYWEEQVVEKLRKQMARVEFQPQFEAFVSRVENLGLTLSFGEEKVNWEGGSYYGGFTYTQEGLDSFTADLIRKEEEKAKKEREEAAANAKAEAEAEAAELGLPQNVRIWHRMGGATNRGCGWVIAPDGTHRESDSVDTSMHGSNTKRYHQSYEGDHVWNQILPGELVLRYYQADRYDIAHCEVVRRPDQVTQAQLVAAKQIEEDMGASENGFGLDDRLSKLIERRIAAIDEAMANLPESLRPEGGWDYQALVSVNGVSVRDGDSWVNHAEPFDEHCEGREAQVVYVTPAADGELVALAYYKWGGWNVNLLWRETSVGSPIATPTSDEDNSAGPVDMETALQRLQGKFGPKHR